MESIEKWVKDKGVGHGYGYGYGKGIGVGVGCRDGYGYGIGYGAGYSDGTGANYGAGDGAGDGTGYSDGTGDGFGRGVGYINGKKVYNIDRVQTVIKSTKGGLAKGYILKSDMSLEPCYIAKGNGFFAHGKTARKAVAALQHKIMASMNTEETIKMFLEAFKKGKVYKVKDFYDWHGYLTGSCEMGRNNFMRKHGLKFDDEMTVDEFLKITKNDFGSDVIKNLSDKWTELNATENEPKNPHF